MFRGELGKLSDEAYLGLKVEVEPFLDSLLSDHDQLTHVLRCRAAEVHHDVGVDVRNLGISVPKSLQPALIHESARSNSFDLLEDGAGTWVKLKPWMSAPTPAQIFLHDSMHHRGISRQEPERDGEYNVSATVENASIVSKAHVIAVNDSPLSFFAQNFG